MKKDSMKDSKTNTAAKTMSILNKSQIPPQILSGCKDDIKVRAITLSSDKTSSLSYKTLRPKSSNEVTKID